MGNSRVVYSFVREFGSDTFEKEINILANDGFEPHGNVVISEGGSYCLLMSKTVVVEPVDVICVDKKSLWRTDTPVVSVTALCESSDDSLYHTGLYFAVCYDRFFVATYDTMLMSWVIDDYRVGVRRWISLGDLL